MFISNILFLSLFSFSFLVATDAVAQKPFQLCYFSLSSAKVSPEKRFSKFEGIEVKEFYSVGGTTPTEQFKKMVEGGTKCDGLVISGHHTGSFYGDNIKGEDALPLETIEKLSCDKPEFFKNIKALWLHGCNTAVDGTIKTNKKTADKATKNFVKKYEPSLQTAHFVNYTYSDVFDLHTPLSSRYLRAFPNTQIYGFSGTASTEQNWIDKKAQDLAEEKIKEIERKRERDKEAPMTKEVRKARMKELKKGFAEKINNDPKPEDIHDDIQAHLQMLSAALKKGTATKDITKALEALSSNTYCDESRKFWEKHYKGRAIKNKKYPEAQKLGCDLIKAKNAYQKALKTGDTTEKKKAEKLILKALEEIRESENENLPRLLFNNIADTYKLAKSNGIDSSFFKEVKEILGTPRFTKPLEDQINSSEISSLRKIDYLKFYEHLKGKEEFEKNDGFARKAIKDQIAQINKSREEVNLSGLNKKQKEEIRKQKRADKFLSVLVAEQLRQYDYLTKDQIDELLENKKLFKNDEKDQSIEAIKYKMEYSSYILDGAKDKELKKLYKAEMKDNKTYTTAFVQEALRKKDMKTLEDLFSIAKETKSGQSSDLVNKLVGAVDSQIITQFVNDSNRDNIYDLIKGSKEDKEFQYSVIRAAKKLGYKDLVKEAKEKKLINKKLETYVEGL